MSSFADWKAKIEAEASRYSDPVAAINAAERKAYEGFQAVCRLFCDFSEGLQEEGVPIEIIAEQLDGLMTKVIDDATAKCQQMLRAHAEDADDILGYWEWYLDFFKGWRETVRGNNPDCLMYSELKQTAFFLEE